MALSKILPAGQDQFAGARNLIINSDFQVSQRGASFTGITSTIAYRMDRWQVGFGAAGSNYSITQATDAPDNFKYSMKWQRTASNAVTNSIWFSQAFESINSKVVAGKTCTLSYYAKKGANYSATSSDIQVRVISGTGTDESATSAITAGWAGYAAPLSTTQVITSSWVRYTHTVTFASNVNQISVNLASNSAGSAGADDSLYITGVQLEVGDGAATPFEHPRSYGDELAKCQRYYYKLKPGSNASGYASCTNNNASRSDGICHFPVTLRAIPTALETTGTATDYGCLTAGTNVNCNSVPTFVRASLNTSFVRFPYATNSVTTGQGGVIQAKTADSFLAWSAEL